jgi:chaperonin GroES
MAKKTPITPVGKRILVKQEVVEEKTKSGLILPDSGKKDRPERGEVIAIGEPLAGVSVGDTVYFGGYDNQEIELGDDKYLVVKHDNISGVLKA